MEKNRIVSEEYSLAATEVLDLLNDLSTDLVEKIPTKLIDFLKEVSDKNYKPQFDYSQGLENVELREKSRALLAMIYRNYLCSDEEKKQFDQMLFQNEEKFQNQLREQYHPDRIFENTKKENHPTLELIEYKEVKWYQKIFQKILAFLKI